MIDFIKNIFLVMMFFLKFLWPILVILLMIPIIRIINYYMLYKNSNYKFESGIKFIKFYFNTGYFGEGLTFMELEKINSYKKIMVNLYIPSNNGTTEIDLLYITSSGVYVIESKNYSGWIFGDENSKNWTSLIYKYKTKFFNPIWQNNKHIKYLKDLIEAPIHSLIIFSERSELKKLNYNNKETTILNRQNLIKYIEKERENVNNALLTNEKIDEIYESLKPYKLKNKEEKLKHINNIYKN